MAYEDLQALDERVAAGGGTPEVPFEEFFRYHEEQQGKREAGGKRRRAAMAERRRLSKLEKDLQQATIYNPALGAQPSGRVAAIPQGFEPAAHEQNWPAVGVNTDALSPETFQYFLGKLPEEEREAFLQGIRENLQRR